MSVKHGWFSNDPKFPWQGSLYCKWHISNGNVLLCNYIFSCATWNQNCTIFPLDLLSAKSQKQNCNNSQQPLDYLITQIELILLEVVAYFSINNWMITYLFATLVYHYWTMCGSVVCRKITETILEAWGKIINTLAEHLLVHVQFWWLWLHLKDKTDSGCSSEITRTSSSM